MDSIEYYNKYAAKVYEDTVDQDMNEIMQEFLSQLESGSTILDLGCGSGRDSLILHELGYDVTPLDASEEMCKLAEIHTGIDVLQMKYEDMEFEYVFDGIWACAALVHIPKKQLSAILEKLSKALKEDGVLYMSVKLGDFEGFMGERFLSYYTKHTVEDILNEVSLFDIVNIWETQDVRSNHSDTKWINVLLKKK